MDIDDDVSGGHFGASCGSVTVTGWPTLNFSGCSGRASIRKTSFARSSMLYITGGVNSAVRATKLIFAFRSLSQPSQDIPTVSPYLISGRTACGAKKRILRLPGGNNATTGFPAGTVSPGRK